MQIPSGNCTLRILSYKDNFSGLAAISFMKKMKALLTTCFLLCFFPANLLFAQKALNITQTDPGKYKVAINKHLDIIERWRTDENISGDSLYKLLSSWDQYPNPSRKGIVCEYKLKLDTNYTASYFVYLPKNYDPYRKTVLLVYYKGGWLSRKSLPADYNKEFINDNPALAYLDEYNVVEIFPVLEAKLAIYGFYGYSHLNKMIIQTKKLFNIDDNKVYLAGFSDGGASVYNAAYLVPTAFACFYPINASMISAPYYPNLINRPIYSFVAEKDELFDRRSMLTKASYVNQLGGNWSYREIPGRKHFYHPYHQEVLPILFDHMQTVSRNPLPNSLVYHRAFNDSSSFPGIDWLQIKVNTSKPPEAFHFTDSVRTYRSNGEENNYLYGEKTGQAKARYFNNCFTIEASQVNSIEIYISPLMVNMDLPVKLIVNGKERFNSRVPFSKDFMTNTFLTYFDRQQVWVNKIAIEL